MSPSTTGGKIEQTDIVFMKKSLRTLQHGTKNVKTYNRTKCLTPQHTNAI